MKQTNLFPIQQVDLFTLKVLTGIATQGAISKETQKSYYVTTFKLEASTNGEDWMVYRHFKNHKVGTSAHGRSGNQSGAASKTYIGTNAPACIPKEKYEMKSEVTTNSHFSSRNYSSSSAIQLARLTGLQLSLNEHVSILVPYILNGAALALHIDVSYNICFELLSVPNSAELMSIWLWTVSLRGVKALSVISKCAAGWEVPGRNESLQWLEQQ